jgi:hypothetical protein
MATTNDRDAARLRMTHELTDDELANSPLADLAKRCGYTSLKSACNDLRFWGQTLGETEAFFREEEASILARAEGRVS